VVVESRVGWGKHCRPNLIKYPSRIRINPILEEVDSFVHCNIHNNPTTKGQLGSNTNIGGDGYIVGLKSRAKTANGRV